METRWQRAIVVGASSGLGEALARRLGAEGSEVALVARRTAELQRIAGEINAAGPGKSQVFPADVRDTGAAAGTFQEITTALGGLDLIIYCAGILPQIGRQEFPTETDVQTIETNLSGAVAWLNPAAARFSEARAGTIVGISSVAGERGRVDSPVYNATKAGLNVYLEALRARLARRGVTIVTIKAGLMRTAMIGARSNPGFLVVSADEAARLTLDAAAARKREAFVPGWWRWIMLLVRSVPDPIFERLNV